MLFVLVVALTMAILFGFGLDDSTPSGGLVRTSHGRRLVRHFERVGLIDVRLIWLLNRDSRIVEGGCGQARSAFRGAIAGALVSVAFVLS